MKAIVYKEYGSPDVLKLAEVDKPSPKDNQLLIRVRAVEATKSDCELRSFNYPVKWFWLPLRLAMGLFRPRNSILGMYFAGEVEAVGGGVSKYKPGDKIFGSASLRMGAYGEYMCLPETATIVAMPHNMSFEQAAAVPLGGLNALHFMNLAKIQKGERVLINGAGASIGTFALQIAKNLGAEVTVVDSGIKEAMLRELGADHFIDYNLQDFTNSRADTDGRYDVIFSIVAGASFKRCIDCLKSNGRYLMANPRFLDMCRSAFINRRTDKKVSFAFAGEKEEELLALKEMIERGKLKSVVDTVFTMEQAPEAHRRVETEQRLGCVVISMGA